ncbi:MAG: 6-pyruvoyl-tetrahydropterin synthase-related protein [Syntrophobacteraceae bacterium]
MRTFRRITPPILFLIISEVLLILFFPASLVFESTLTAGGDTPSHFLSAVAMNRGLFAIFSPVTWIHGAYAGFPLFLQYFPLPFALMALISKAVSLQIAFKLVTLLAIIPLPAAVYLCLRRLRYGQNTAAIGAMLSLPFLFITENSMWGGNISSTLSGEFAFGISFILYIIFTAKLYSDISEGKSPLGNSALEALMALGHGYPLVQSVMGTSYFILRGRNLRTILQLHAAAFGLAAFWLLPLLWRIPWNTPSAISWHFEKWAEIAPPLLWPSFAGALMVAVSGIRNFFRPAKGLSALSKASRDRPTQTIDPTGDALRATPGTSLSDAHENIAANDRLVSLTSPSFAESIDGPEFYLFWQFGIALLCFSLAPSLGLVDIRFLPFAQIMLVLLGAVGWGRLLSRLPRPNLWLACFCAGIIALALTRAATVDSWIQWNYSGMESKPFWNSYRLVNEYLKGDKNSPRVVYEQNEITNRAGTSRAFELLPYYSGRSTLEGLYMQSSPTSPFVFYMQSELSQTPSTPLSQYYYSRPDPDRAADRLRLFNVSQVIALSDNIANALDSSPDYELAIACPPYRIYLVRRCGDSYVEPLRFRPLRIPSRDWKKVQFEWFRKSTLRVPLVVAPEDSPGDFWKELQNYDGNPERIPEIPILQADRVSKVLQINNREKRGGWGDICPPHPLPPLVMDRSGIAWRSGGKLSLPLLSFRNFAEFCAHDPQALEAYVAQIRTPSASEPQDPINHPEDETIRTQAILGDGKITIDTSKPGHPLWIKVSYHPDWRITEGAGELYLASPAFMLLVPRTSRVVLTFDTGSGIYLWGKILFFLTVMAFILKTLLTGATGGILEHRKGPGRINSARLESPPPLPSKIGINARFLAAYALMAAITLGAIFTRNHRDPVLLYDLAAGKFEGINNDKNPPYPPLEKGGETGPGEPAFQDSLDSASRPAWPDVHLLDECIVKFGHSSELDSCMFYKASLMSAWKRWDGLRPMLEEFLEKNPDSRIYAEGLTWMGEACLNTGKKEDAERFFRQALFSWPEGNATKQSGLRLAEMIGPDTLLDTAKGLLTSGRYLEAYNIYRALTLSPDKNIRDQSVLSLAYCSFYMNRTEEASNLLIQWLNDNFEAPESPQVQADLRHCQAIIAQTKEWITPYPGAASPARSGLVVRFLDWAGQRLR